MFISSNGLAAYSLSTNLTVPKSTTTTLLTNSALSPDYEGLEYDYVAGAQSFTFTAKGLKPLSQHYFTFGGANVCSQCQPHGGTLGGPIVTDASGNVVFTYYYNSGIANTATTIGTTQSMINSVIGTKQGVLATSDGTSHATCTVQILSSTLSEYGWPANTYAWYY
jgi:hypothetical protein